MVVVLVHWLIKLGSEQDFEKHWKSMTIEKDSGLYREILTTPERNTFDPKFQSFTLESPNYRTYINVGIWSSLEAFDRAINKYFPKATSEINERGKTVQTIELENFEFKLRERIVLRRVHDRGVALPEANSIE